MFSPWLNGINERNHHSEDVILKKIVSEDEQIMLKDSGNMASWTHNTNLMIGGCTLLQLMPGKKMLCPGISTGYIATESLYNDEGIRRIMETYDEMLTKQGEQEYKRKIDEATNSRLKGYHQVSIQIKKESSKL